jgi:hypothetical protein
MHSFMDISKNTSSVSSLLGSLMLLNLMQYVSLKNLFTAFDRRPVPGSLGSPSSSSNSASGQPDQIHPSLFFTVEPTPPIFFCMSMTLSLPAPAPPSFARSSTGYEPNSLFGTWAPSASSSTSMSNEPGMASDSAKTTNANRRR